MINIVSLSRLGGLMENISNWVQNTLLNYVVGGLFRVLYTIICSPIFLLIDGLQVLFKKFAGLDTYFYDKELQSGDVVLSLINNQTVQNTFWALLILAVVLLVIFTVVAIIKSETKMMDDKGRKTKNMIFARAVRSLLNFFMVPVVAILGIFMGNALLKSLDMATNSENVKLSGALFKACAYDCNRARRDSKIATDFGNDYNTFGVLNGSAETIADEIDDAFENRLSFKEGDGTFVTESNPSKPSMMGNYNYWSKSWTEKTSRDSFNIYNAWTVWFYYDLISFNYLTFIVAGVFMLYVLLVTSVGLIKRMFKLVILLCIAPPIAAIGPVDDGKALGQWQQQFISSVLSAYSTIVSLNLFLMLIGPIYQIDFFYFGSSGLADVGGGALNSLVHLLILCGGLAFFKSFTADIAKMIGAENAYADGAEAATKIAKTAGKIATAKTAFSAAIKQKNLLGLKKKEQGELKDKKAGAEDKKNEAEDKRNKAKTKFYQVINDPNASREEKDAARKEYDDAQAEFNTASQAADKASKDLSDNKKDISTYKNSAKELFAKSRANFASAATNGLTDTAGYGDRQKLRLETGKLKRSVDKKYKKAFRGVGTRATIATRKGVYNVGKGVVKGVVKGVSVMSGYSEDKVKEVAGISFRSAAIGGFQTGLPKNEKIGSQVDTVLYGSQEKADAEREEKRLEKKNKKNKKDE